MSVLQEDDLVQLEPPPRLGAPGPTHNRYKGLPEEERWFGLVPTGWRFNLARIPLVRRLLRSRWTSFVLALTGFLLFVPALVAGFFGTKVGNANLIIVLVWIFWWSLLMMVLVPLASRIWCAVCPLPVPGEWLQRLSFVQKARAKALGLQKKWPKALRSMWPVNFIFLGLAMLSGILTTRPIATAIMLGSIIVADIGVALVFEKRTFCRYLCPVGGFLGLYSNFGALEVRHDDYAICRGHKEKECVVGTGAAYACPWMESPTTLARNTYCGMCFECFRTCSHDNMALNVRPMGSDLLVDSHRGLDEAWKGFIMLGAAGVYSATMMGPWAFLKDMANMRTWQGGLLYGLLVGFALAVVVPAIFGLFTLASTWLGGAGVSFKRAFVNFCYPLVPMGLFAWIGFSFAILLPNVSYLARVPSDPLGLGWNLFGTAQLAWKPAFLGWMPYLQIAAVLLGLLFSLDSLWKIARQTYGDRKLAARAALPQVLLLTLIGAGFLQLFVG